MSDDLAALTRQLGVCELQEQRLLRVVQLATSSRDHLTTEFHMDLKKSLSFIQKSILKKILFVHSPNKPASFPKKISSLLFFKIVFENKIQSL